MPQTPAKVVWGVYGDSSRGSSHLRNGLPNQDSIARWAAPGGKQAVLAVSDGHGSASHFRSDQGSRMGVDVAVATLRGAPLPIPEGHAQVLAQAIVDSWRAAVAEHLAGNPFTDEEWAKVPAKEAAQAKATVQANPSVAYGATLLCVLATGSEILFLQLGDGDILCVDSSGGTTRPMPTDSRLIANQTTSLCQASAVQDFRVAHISLSEAPPPALILVSSDGYSNSFQSEEDFLRLGPDYLELLRTYGPEKVEAQLQKILPEASRKGSGDDITLGFIQLVEDGGKPAISVPQSAAAPAPAAAPPPASQSSPPPARMPEAPATGVKRAQSVPVETVRTVKQEPKPVSQAAMPASQPPAAGRETGSSSSERLRVRAENDRLRRKLFLLKVALAGVFILALAGAGVAWWHPEWLGRMKSKPKPAPPAVKKVVHVPLLHPGSYV